MGPDTFDNVQIDKAVAYARAVGAEPILQVPLLAADPTGKAAPADTAAAMVTYANVTAKYGIKYVSAAARASIKPPNHRSRSSASRSNLAGAPWHR